MADDETTTSTKVFFKKAKQRSRRKSLTIDDNEDDDEVNKKLVDMKFIQKLRGRPNGVDILGLSAGRATYEVESKDDKDPFKVKSGGVVNLKNVSVSNVDDAYDVGIGTQFSAETNKRDEDEEMMKYIEQQMSKKKAAVKGMIGSVDAEHQKYFSPEDAALAALPDHLKAPTTQRSEEMLSNQMLSGIPEVDLGIESKIKNIEATEEAKLKIIRGEGRKLDAPSQFVPTNIAVNFAQSNKSTNEDAERKEKRKIKKRSATESGQTTERATDDFHFEKFKKLFRRH